MRVGLLTTAIFGDLSDFFGNFGDSLRPAILYDDMLFHVKLGFCSSSFRFRGFDYKA